MSLKAAVEVQARRVCQEAMGMTLMTSRKSTSLHAGYTFAPSLAHCASGVLVTQVYILSVSLLLLFLSQNLSKPFDPYIFPSCIFFPPNPLFALPACASESEHNVSCSYKAPPIYVQNRA